LARITLEVIKQGRRYPERETIGQELRPHDHGRQFTPAARAQQARGYDAGASVDA
jgi:hypothetical protein